MLAVVVGARWLTAPDAYPDQLAGPTADGSLVALLDPTLVSSLLVLLGVIGAVAAATSRWLLPIGAAYAVVFGLLATDLGLLVAMGYSAAILGPPLLFAYLVAASVRRPMLRWLVGGLVAGAAVLAAATGADAATFADFGRGLGEGFSRSGIHMLVVIVSFVGGALWLLLALRAAGLRRVSASDAYTYVAPRRDWGWWVTVVAALCPLPYALMRMTWLTPWPTLMDAAVLDADPALRIFGLSLGFAAIGGSVLTIGLLRRWGSVYPRWIPAVGGRPVSPTWPTAFAIVVGTALTVAGRSMAQMSIGETDVVASKVEAFLMLPFPVWGPLLIAAAIAYYRRRTNG